MSSAPITVGICTYNRSKVLKRCLDALLSQTEEPQEIIVFDNSEGKETEDLIETYTSPLIRYIHHPQRTDIPKGRNIILNEAKSEIITYLDDDSIATPNFIKGIADGFRNFPVRGVTGPAIDSNENLEPLGKIFISNKNHAFILPWGEIRNETRHWLCTKPVLCSAMKGNNMSYRTADLKEIGGFDENLTNPSFREESDVQMRLLRKGYKFLFHPDARVWHIPKTPGGIEDVEAKQKNYFYLAGKNHRYFCDKYFPKVLTRLSWIFWSRNPPCLWAALILWAIGKKNYIYWHKGLWLT